MGISPHLLSIREKTAEVIPAARRGGRCPGGQESTRERDLFGAGQMRSFPLPRFSRYRNVNRLLQKTGNAS
jgi:hypothetical protein